MTRRARLVFWAALVLTLHVAARLEGPPAAAGDGRAPSAESRPAADPDRLRLGRAHRARREGDLEAALLEYEALLLDVDAAPARRDEAAWWWARTHELAGDAAGAERGWRRVVERARDPRLRARAWDRLARARLAAGDVEGARHVLEACDRALADLAAQRSPQGAALRATLESLPARRRIEADLVER